MRSATLTRRGQARSAVDPSSIFGSAVVGWWRSDSLSGLSDGTGIASWADKSANANTLTQATGANQPVKQTDSTVGVPVARFAIASHHNLAITSPVGLKDAPGPLTVIVIAKPAATSGVQTFVEYAGAGNKGFAAALNGPQMELEDYVHPNTTTIGAAGSVLRQFHYEMRDSTHSGYDVNNRFGIPVTTAGVFSVGSTKLALGGSLLYNQWWFGGDLYEVIYLNRLITANERDLLARAYTWPRYGVIQGNQYNAAAALTVPTVKQSFGGSATADGTVVEASVRYFPSLWNGHKYWMACVPFNGGPAVENPHIFYGDDNVTWTTPAGVTQPLVQPISAGNNADPKLVYNSSDGKLYLFYIVENHSTASNDGVWFVSSADGSTWSAPAKVFTSPSNDFDGEPNINWDGTQWVMHSVQLLASPTVLNRRTSASLTSGWSAASTCGLSFPGGRTPWHMDVIYTGGVWYMACSDNDSTRNMWLAKSTDGVNFSSAGAPILAQSTTGWDNGTIYRPSLLPPDDTTTNWRLWYTTNISQPNSFVGYTEFPPSMLP